MPTPEPFHCPTCGSDRLRAERYEDEFLHAGRSLHVRGLERYRCEHCGADPIFEDQIRRNHRRIADARRAADGLLTGDEIRAIREALGLTQQEAAAVFGGGVNAFSKYERGDVIQSVAMDRLLRLVGTLPYLLDLLRADVGRGEMSSGGYVRGPQVRVKGRAAELRAKSPEHVIEIGTWRDAKRAA